MSCFTQIWVSHASRLHEQLLFNRWEATKNFVRTRSGSIPKAEQDQIQIVSTRYKDTTILGNPDADDMSLNVWLWRRRGGGAMIDVIFECPSGG